MAERPADAASAADGPAKTAAPQGDYSYTFGSGVLAAVRETAAERCAA